MPNAQPMVNSFNGLSDESVAARRAQSLWDAGAFNADGKPDPTQGQKAPEPKTAAAPAPAAAPPAVEGADPVAEAPEPEAQVYASLNEYLEKTGLEAASFYELPVSVKVDGQESQVKLADLLKGHQQEADYTRKTQALAEQRKAWEQQETQAKQAVTQHLERAQALGNLAHQQLLAEFQAVDWNGLRAQRPDEWAAKNLEFNQRAQAIQQHLAQVDGQRQQLLAQQLPQERERLLNAIPEWRDPTVATAGKTAIAKYASSRGLTDAELGSLYDHRFMLVLHDASRAAALQAELTELKAKVAGKVQQVRAAPVAPAPGTRTTRDPKVAQLQSARESFKKARSDPDAQARYAQALIEAGV
jgi:hypothetical protein